MPPLFVELLEVELGCEDAYVIPDLLDIYEMEDDKEDPVQPSNIACILAFRHRANVSEPSLALAVLEAPGSG